MTSAQNFPYSESPREEDKSSSPLLLKRLKSRGRQSGQPSGPKDDQELLSKSPKKARTLQGQLLLTLLPTALLPLVIISGVNYWLSQRKVRAEQEQNLKQVTVLASEVGYQFVNDKRLDSEILSVTPLLLQSLESADRIVAERQLTQLPAESLEAYYGSTKVLELNTNLTNYLQTIAIKNDLEEIFFTDRNGFTVGYSQITSDFVQSDDSWWQGAQQNGFYADVPEFDESTQSYVLPLATAIQDQATGTFLGVIQSAASLDALNQTLREFLEGSLRELKQVQIVDPFANQVVTSVRSNEEGQLQIIPPDELVNQGVVGGDTVAQITASFKQAVEVGQTADQVVATLEQEHNLANIKATEFSAEGSNLLTVLFPFEDQTYALTVVNGTDWVAVSSIDTAELRAVGNEILIEFVILGILLSIVTVGIILRLSRQVSTPIDDLSNAANQMAEGNLNIKATEAGTLETRQLAATFNKLIQQVKNLLDRQKKETEEQQQRRQELEGQLFSMMERIEDAVDGDLTTRAQLMEGEIGIVADLFNAVIENLQDIALQVRESSEQVNNSLTENEQSIGQLAERAIVETKSIQKALRSVQAVSKNIDKVAENAEQASTIANSAYETVQQGNYAMDQTVDSILGLRSTIGDTAKKMKRLGESAQKISQVVALIDELALKTNLLSINASVEAARAGELGQGFTAVAEQVGALAEQSASATKEIAKIVTSIQAETQELVAAMETGTTQVVASTRQVESTKQQLADVLQRSQEIDQLMREISASAVAQAESTQSVFSIMGKVAQSSKQRSLESRAVAQAMQDTAQVSQQLQASVEQFKVD